MLNGRIMHLAGEHAALASGDIHFVVKNEFR